VVSLMPLMAQDFRFATLTTSLWSFSPRLGRYG
jgi:hypothetical protein